MIKRKGFLIQTNRFQQKKSWIEEKRSHKIGVFLRRERTIVSISAKVFPTISFFVRKSTSYPPFISERCFCKTARILRLIVLRTTALFETFVPTTRANLVVDKLFTLYLSP